MLYQKQITTKATTITTITRDTLF